MMDIKGYRYKIIFPFGSGNDESEVVMCNSLKPFKSVIFEYLKKYNNDIVKVVRGRKTYCEYAYDNGVMYRIGANNENVIRG